MLHGRKSEMNFIQVERLADDKFVQLNIDQIVSLEKASDNEAYGIATVVTDVRGVRYLTHTAMDLLKSKLEGLE